MEDLLLQKYNDYMRLKNCRAEYLLSNGLIIDFTYKEENFIHLLGLHKLTDIQLIQLFNDKNNKVVQTKYIINRIKKGRFNDNMVKSSVFYKNIETRYKNFSYDNLTTLTYTDAAKLSSGNVVLTPVDAYGNATTTTVTSKLVKVTAVKANGDAVKVEGLDENNEVIATVESDGTVTLGVTGISATDKVTVTIDGTSYTATVAANS